MRVLIAWADDSSPNLGVRALASGTAALVQRAFPGAEIAMVSYGLPAEPMPVGSWRALCKERVTGRHGLMHWLGRHDLVMDTRAGDSFADIYGLPRLMTQSTFAELAAQAGVPVVMGPQTYGPFRTRRGRVLAKRSMSRAAALMSRDSESTRFLRRVGFNPVETTDVVFALPVPSVERTRDVVLNVSGLLWRDNPHVSASRYRQTVLRLAREVLAEGRSLTLLAHVQDSPDPDNDVPAMREVFGELGDLGVESVVPQSLWDVREVLASSQVVVGSRMHACLNAISVGTPAVPLAYSRKFAPLLADIGWPHSVDLRDDADHVALVRDRLSDGRLHHDVRRVRERADERLNEATAALLRVR